MQPGHVGIETFDDLVGQVTWSHHWMDVQGRLVRHAAPYRYVWPSELDLMAQLAGLRLRDRRAGWSGEPFTSDSTSQVAVYERARLTFSVRREALQSSTSRALRARHPDRDDGVWGAPPGTGPRRSTHDAGSTTGPPAARPEEITMLASQVPIPADAALTTMRTRLVANVGAYVAVNTVLVVIWLVTRGDGTPFWPIWSIGLWGIGVAGQAWRTHRLGTRVADERTATM